MEGPCSMREETLQAHTNLVEENEEKGLLD
jgi:hypothetical protein